MEDELRKKNGPAPGSILVMGLLFVCFVGTGLTWWNYTRQVFSSADGIVLEAQQGSESRISVELPLKEAGQVLPGHGARITVGNDARAFKGEVVSVTPRVNSAAVIIRLLFGEGDAGGRISTGAPTARTQECHFYPPVGARCGVTIDTTVPPFSRDLPK